MKTMFELKKEVHEKREALIQKKAEFDLSILRDTNDLKELEELLELAVNGAEDLEKLELGKKIVLLRGEVNSSERRAAVDRAIDDLLTTKGKKLQKESMNCKQYEAFGDQECDCEYGFGPRHGSIVFRCGLNPDYRRDLSDQEAEAAIYFLSQIKK